MCSRVLSTTKVWGYPSTALGGDSARSIADSHKDRASSSSSSRRPPPLKTLRLSNAMHPQYISFQVLLAIKCSSYNALACQGLDLTLLDENSESHANEETKAEAVATNEIASAASFLQHLRVLIYSRNWLRIEFDQCKGIESLFSDSSEPKMDLGLNTTKVGFLVLKFPRSNRAAGNKHKRCTYDASHHTNFFTNLWNHWRVQKLNLSMDFTPAWTKEFCRSRYHQNTHNDDTSDNANGVANGETEEAYLGLEELELYPACTWHRRIPKSTKSNDGEQRDPSIENGCSSSVQVADDAPEGSCGGSGAAAVKTSNDDDDDDDETMDCWEYFCRQLPLHHPRLGSLSVQCKTSDADMAYLIRHCVSSPLFVALHTLRFGNMCSCDEQSLAALAGALAKQAGTTASAPASATPSNPGARPRLPQRLEILSMSRGRKLLSPSAAGLLAGGQQQRGRVLDVCRALAAASVLKHLELSDYFLDRTDLEALFGSLVDSGGAIQRLSLLSCGVACRGDYKPVKECLVRNELPFLKVLLLPEAASGILGEALRFNTSVENVNYSRGGSPTLRYFLDLNRGGRRILTTASTTTFHADAAAGDRGHHCHEDQRQPPGGLATRTTLPAVSPALYPRILDRASHMTKHGYLGGDQRKYDVVYYMLRNRILLEM